MQVSRVRALRGPNLWSHHTSIEAVVIITPGEESVGAMAGFETRLRALFPQLSPLQPTGHDDTIPLAHVLELAALDLQAQAGCPVTFSRTTKMRDALIDFWSKSEILLRQLGQDRASSIHQAKYWVMYSPASEMFDSNMMKMTLCENSC